MKYMKPEAIEIQFPECKNVSRNFSYHQCLVKMEDLSNIVYTMIKELHLFSFLIGL